MEYLTQTIRLNNPAMSATRTEYHATQLRKLFYTAHDASQPLNTHWFKNELAVLNQLSDLDSPKLYIPSLIRLFPKSRHYRNLMMIDGKERKKTFSDIETDLLAMTDDVAPLLHYNGYIGQTDYIRLQNHAIASLMSGIWIPVYRVIDISTIKIRNFNRVADNFYDGTTLAFQKPFYDEITVPDELKTAIDALARHTPYDYLFMNGDERLPIQRFNYILRNTFSVGAKELLKIRLDTFPFDVIPDFCNDATEPHHD